jgi:hypothetical protein
LDCEEIWAVFLVRDIFLGSVPSSSLLWHRFFLLLHMVQESLVAASLEGSDDDVLFVSVM